MAQFKRFNASENDNYDTNAVYPAGTLTWDPDNGIRLHNGSTSGGVAVGGGSLTATDNYVEVKVSDLNQNYYSVKQTLDDGNNNTYASTELRYDQFTISTDLQNGTNGYQWRFENGGQFRIPGNINTYDTDIEILAMNAGNAGNITIKTQGHINNTEYSSVQLTQSGVNITTDLDGTPGGKTFEFRDTGILVLPSSGDIQNASGDSLVIPQALGAGHSPEFAGLYISGHSGNEGGEIRLALPDNTTLTGDGISIDIYQDKIRIFENGGSARGVYIDLTTTSTNAGTNLLAGGSSGSSYITKNANFTAEAGKTYWLDSGTTARTVTLPASPAEGDWIRIYDGSLNWQTYNLTVDGNGNNVRTINMGSGTWNTAASTATLNQAMISPVGPFPASFIWNGTVWSAAM